MGGGLLHGNCRTTRSPLRLCSSGPKSYPRPSNRVNQQGPIRRSHVLGSLVTSSAITTTPHPPTAGVPFVASRFSRSSQITFTSVRLRAPHLCNRTLSHGISQANGSLPAPQHRMAFGLPGQLVVRVKRPYAQGSMFRVQNNGCRSMPHAQKSMPPPCSVPPPPCHRLPAARANWGPGHVSRCRWMGRDFALSRTGPGEYASLGRRPASPDAATYWVHTRSSRLTLSVRNQIQPPGLTPSNKTVPLLDERLQLIRGNPRTHRHVWLTSCTLQSNNPKTSTKASAGTENSISAATNGGGLASCPSLVQQRPPSRGEHPKNVYGRGKPWSIELSRLFPCANTFSGISGSLGLTLNLLAQRVNVVSARR